MIDSPRDSSQFIITFKRRYKLDYNTDLPDTGLIQHRCNNGADPVLDCFGIKPGKL
jgi:hypothetical protein